MHPNGHRRRESERHSPPMLPPPNVSTIGSFCHNLHHCYRLVNPPPPTLPPTFTCPHVMHILTREYTIDSPPVDKRNTICYIGGVKADTTNREGQMHSPITCKRAMGVELRYSYKNWSDLFRCPSCGASKRQSLNYLGGRYTLACDGEHIYRVERKAIELQEKGAAR